MQTGKEWRRAALEFQGRMLLSRQCKAALIWGSFELVRRVRGVDLQQVGLEQINFEEV